MFQVQEIFESDDSLPPVLRDQDVIWLSPSQISNDLCNLNSHFSPKMSDVVQGFHGGYFLSGIITLINTKNENVRNFGGLPRRGLLEYAFYKKDGTTVRVRINDLLPTRNGKLVFAQAPNNRFWCPLLEKAYAKFLGGYQHLSMGKIPDTVHPLTGHFMSCHDPSQYSNQELLNWIRSECEQNHPIVCKTKHSDGNNGEHGRGYAVIGFAGVNNEGWFCIRDPRKSITEIISIEDFKRDFDVIGTLNTLQLLSKKAERAMECLNPFSERYDSDGRLLVGYHSLETTEKMFESDESLPPCLKNTGVTWLTPSEILNGIPPIVDDPPKIEDVLQGFHGGFFLSGVISLINTHDEHVSGFKGTPTSNGLLEYTFFKRDGTVEKVEINDKLPTKDGMLVFAQAPGNKFWCPLLEKAVAKFLGGYQELSLGKLHRPIQILTGKLLTCTSICRYPDKNIKKMIRSRCRHQRPMACRTSHGERTFAIIGNFRENDKVMIIVRDPLNITPEHLTFEEFKEKFDVVGHFKTPRELPEPTFVDGSRIRRKVCRSRAKRVYSCC